VEKSQLGIQFDAYMASAERGDVGGRIGALRAMLGLTKPDIDPMKESLEMVEPKMLWRCKIDAAQDYSSALQRERQMMQQAVHVCAFTGFRTEDHERATACVVRVLVLELMPDALRPCMKSAPPKWKPREYIAARRMFEVMQPGKFNINEVGIPGIALTRKSLGEMIEEAYVHVMGGGF
jgi:hypothetical protein